MKRKDIEVGGEYATDAGVHVRVESLDPGYTVDPETGDWVHRPAYAKRFIKERGYVDYQTNIALKATTVPEGRKVVVEPRHLLGPWSEYEVMYAQQREQEGLLEANADALLARAGLLGLEPSVDPSRNEVVLTFDGFDTLLRRAKV